MTTWATNYIQRTTYVSKYVPVEPIYRVYGSRYSPIVIHIADLPYGTGWGGAWAAVISEDGKKYTTKINGVSKAADGSTDIYWSPGTDFYVGKNRLQFVVGRLIDDGRTFGEWTFEMVLYCEEAFAEVGDLSSSTSTTSE